MKIVSMTLVGNECDIIESFVRYNSNFVDEMLLITSGCTDNTLPIIRNLMSEGYKIVLKDESILSYEQRYIENKYMNYLAEQKENDLIVPLDTDEFLSAEENPRSILESLSLDYIYELEWKTYVMHPDDDMSEHFIPKRLLHCKKKEKKETKVIVPAKLIAEKKIVLAIGRHHAFGEDVEVKELHNLRIAHFPVRSKEQYISKLYGSSINFITWMNRGNGEGAHINKQIAQMEDGKDIYSCANGYGIEDIHSDDIIIDPVSLEFCKNTLSIRYNNLAQISLIHNLINAGQVAAIRAYRLEVEKKMLDNKPRILVYGAGKAAVHMLSGVPEDLVNIYAYIDSDLNKRFTMFNRRLVISVGYARFFPYDKIVIPSQKYYKEMLETLIQEGVEQSNIEGIGYLFALMDIK